MNDAPFREEFSVGRLLSCIVLEAHSRRLRRPHLRARDVLSLLRVVLSLTAVSAAPALSLPALHTRGPDIVDARGRGVTLTGVNLGGWLEEEMWIDPWVIDPPAGSRMPKVQDHASLWGVVRQRFGTAGEARLRTAFRNAWLTEEDFARLERMGVNCVRLPFQASLMDETGGVQWLDRAISWAGRHGIYVILDMHGAPGGQSGAVETGQLNLNRFFADAVNVRRAERIWATLARRYRDNPVVAGYDLVNEPMGAPGSDTLYVVMDHLYQAVRAVDAKHIVIIEDGYTGVQWMPYPIPCGWTNVVYSLHRYDTNAKTDEDERKGWTDYLAGVAVEQAKRQVPYYIGEYNVLWGGSPDTLAWLLQTFRRQGFSSSLWTYKVVWAREDRRWGLMWSLYSNATDSKPMSPLNAFTDSLDDLVQKCAQVRTERLLENTGSAQAFAKTSQAGGQPTP